MSGPRIEERHGHWSLRFDADPERVAGALAHRILSEHLTLLTTTESRNRALVRELRKLLPPGYRVVRRFEYLIIWHRPTYQSHWLARLAVLDPRSWRMLGGHRLFRIACKRLTHRPTGTRVRVEVGHAPSGIDGGAGHWSTAHHDRVVIANRGFDRWGRRARRFQRRHPDGALFLQMDSNLDQLAAAWRMFLTRRLGAASVWDLAGLDHHGSHGGRLIDTAQIAGNVHIRQFSADVDTRPRPPQLDHAAIFYTSAY